VKRCHGGDLALHWTSNRLLEAEKKSRGMKGYPNWPRCRTTESVVDAKGPGHEVTTR